MVHHHYQLLLLLLLLLVMMMMMMVMMVMTMMMLCVMYSDTVEYLYLSLSDDDVDMLHAVGIVAGSHVSVTSLSHADGAHLSTHLVSAPWIKAHHTYDLFCHSV